MQRQRTNSRSDWRHDLARSLRRRRDQGVVITLVAIFMLFVVGAMAALSIDVVTIYTARSEAQLAADGAALAAARVLANSGLTSTGGGPPAVTEDLARSIATQVAANNLVGGRNLIPGGPCAPGTEISVCFNDGAATFATDPRVTVTVQRTDLPTFFARIWGRTQVTVAASATAEAYNPSGATALVGSTTPVAPLCVKPWLLPNLDPTASPSTAGQIFNPDGSILATSVLGQSWPNTGANGNPVGLSSLCSNCNGGALPAPQPGQYYPGAIDPADFAVPTALPGCSVGFNPYQLAVAACVPQPISCNATINIDVNTYGLTRDADTVQATSCLIHDQGAAGDADSLIGQPNPTIPFQFQAGNQNPVGTAVVGKEVLVSDSLVTIPVINNPPGTPTTSSVTVIGFLQVFLSPAGASLSGTTQIPATIINIAGCGTAATGQPILGNGASPVAVRLISPP